ncbi:hypothetical protein COW36_17460 [bacterium (Candidatus Blackallbacteria) CG17_big_fil_post_rev_8_21_14_2_50_48_46]|uniref:tRNA uridine(34) hydroxylase n=1 Tax=bacterium (Candidatus Blackallbacteria) CG17_big_fil_post_rev_8_21_14_2_50_48_46 TaxID=2014261 RepID=A0A2M7G0K7_9BACT|nr:MAG: hypothetical protein COW64_01270 [bacterium (Candidatus Blackallbacteria) CG18_big_fil_WC_8_21_14_2_50_49_26]PIW15209.1 MAG: hypothetical protein COW36_17460 [bacterium (Candidatus Blackallbacteria) CG17_big_fil_post_rev_8_21_14_2_50_48_46]PIW44796.1 MAG: hypothetical protein COW20_22795 [bacterium (Candidatus Blackallbacteria) CG13_big_fil_rev_8_21_14_2_50_49_14]
MTVQIATFYRFFSFPDYQAWQPRLIAFCRAQALKGTILLAAEGLNATLAGSREELETLLAYLGEDSRLLDLEPKWSEAANMPFQRLKVRLKKEIVSLGVPVDPVRKVGAYVSPENWNALISDPEVLLLDTRNHYEVRIGTFAGAVDPHTDSFREFPDYVRKNLDPQTHRKVAMFCTGGIRCEKATSYLLEQGFDQVYHLEGGILKYLETVPAEESRWQGECFVFDQRVAVEQGVSEGHYVMCLACGEPVSQSDLASPDFEAGVACPACVATHSAEQKARAREKQRQKVLAEAAAKKRASSVSSQT